jgi:predicted acyl esterase
MDQHDTPGTSATAPLAHQPWRGRTPPDQSTGVMRFYLGALRSAAAVGTQSLEFVSEPLARPAPLQGLMSGELAFVSDRHEFDFDVTLFELTDAGEYLELSFYQARAGRGVGHARPARMRPRHLSFQSARRIERVLAAGSRIVVRLDAGRGSRELDSVKEAGAALRVRWHGDSFVEIPLAERANTRWPPTVSMI